MLVALRQKGKPLGRFLAVFLLALQVCTQLGHYREHRPSSAVARHARHHTTTPHTDIVTPEVHHACALCVLTSSSATLSVALLSTSHALLVSQATQIPPPEAGCVRQRLRRASPRAPPVS